MMQADERSGDTGQDPRGRVKIGVYVCHCGVNIASTVDIEDVVNAAKTLPGVCVARDYAYLCSSPGQDFITKDIREFGLDKIVVAACSPAVHELTFRNVCQSSGLNPYCLEIANIREQCSWVHGPGEATQKAKRVVAAAVARAALLEALTDNESDVYKEALVIGGGISGIQTALDIAEAGFKVHLVERSPSIGGRMAQLDKTFPTLDCAACILTPKMVEVYRHPNVELLTYAEVVEVSGYVGNFTARVRKKPRYVDVEKCVACGLCAEACRLKGRIPSEFDEGFGNRSAIYVPFTQAVPAQYTVDAEHCLFLTLGKCGDHPACAQACPADAVDFGQEEEIVDLNVGAVVVATGYDQFDPRLKPEYGYEQYDEVITGPEFERLVSASGPTEGKVLVNGKAPGKVVFVKCVGSRDKLVGNEYCSRVCCMYTAKQAYLLREKLPDAEITIFYIDVRAFGKGFEEFYDRVRESGVTYVRGNASEIYRKGGKLIVQAEDTMAGEVLEVEADLVVLATGLVARGDAPQVAALLGIPRGPDGFLMEAHPKLRPVDTVNDGIFLAGCCQGPKDIPDAVAQAKGAASAAIGLLSKDKITTEPITAEVDEDRCSGCRICEGVCPYGALQFDDEKKRITVNTILCRGCGACGATCPCGAITSKHFTDAQILAQLEALT